MLSDYAQLGQRMRRVTQIVREMREMRETRDDEQAAPAAADAAPANPEEGTACVPAARTSSKLKSCCSLSSSFLVSLNP